ncbi:MAG TPA: 50S ribosomal protein L3 N(5)-glutamine methyltransferase [Candidatus Didemnitutus sp.]|nr:50S ribosomal protein L3 N(5)-glutamine methyltransferase [Candidatus Didemnitutus sp.]
MPAKPRTLGDWLHWAEARYVRHKIALGQVATSAHDEALYLLLHALGLPLDSPRGVLKRVLIADEAERVETLFERRLKDRVPAAYLTREAWLGPYKFYVDERVIIPRSYFLELLPEQIPQWLPRRPAVQRVVDVCTGSGCLAVLLAKQFPRARVDAIDISADALAVARFNVAQHRLAQRIRLWRSDVFDAVPRARYDVILSNPPYVPARELAGLPPEFRREPALALDGGRDGFDVIRKLLRQARDRLQPHGIAVLEVGGLRKAMDRQFAELEPHWLHTTDGEDCVCVIQQHRLAAWRE